MLDGIGRIEGLNDEDAIVAQNWSTITRAVLSLSFLFWKSRFPAHQWDVKSCNGLK